MYTFKAGVRRWKKGEVVALLDASKAAVEALLINASEVHFLDEVSSKTELKSKPENVVKLNVGGKCVNIHRETLTQVPSRLAWMMNGRWDDCFPRDKAGRLFLDLDYEWIEPVFCYLRDLAERENEPSDSEDPLCLVISGSNCQMEVLRWLEMEFLLDGWTPRSGEETASSPPRKKPRLDEFMGVFERAFSAVEDVRTDCDSELVFMAELKEMLGHEDRRSLLHFNVGGTPFTVSKHTIAQAPASKLWAQYCSGRWEVQDRELDQDGSIFLDMDPGCFGKIISCLRLAALAKDRGCDVQTWHRSVVIEPSQSRCFDRMVAYLQIEDTVFDGILERREDYTAGPLSKTIRRFSGQLTEWVGTPPRTWKLLYRGSRDGFTADAFHAACDGKGATVVIVKDTNNSVFGGCSSVSWTSNTLFVDSPGAFLFSLSRKGVLDPTAAVKCPLPQPHQQYNHNSLGPSWRSQRTGQWCLQISDGGGASNLSGIMGDACLLTGGLHFVMGEMEVYATITKE